MIHLELTGSSGCRKTPAVLGSLSRAFALLMTRRTRGRGSNSEVATTERTAFDSNGRSLSGVPVLQADAITDVLEEVGQLKLAHPEELVRPPRVQIPTRVGASLLGVPVAAEHEVPYWGAGDGIWFVSGEGAQLRRASSLP